MNIRSALSIALTNADGDVLSLITFILLSHFTLFFCYLFYSSTRVVSNKFLMRFVGCVIFVVVCVNLLGWVALLCVYDGWNLNFGNTPLDWIQELLV